MTELWDQMLEFKNHTDDKAQVFWICGEQVLLHNNGFSVIPSILQSDPS
jgi:hypothetical protein